MNQKPLPVIIVGTGGASKETYYLIKKINAFEDSFSVLGFMERDSDRIGEVIFDGQEIIVSDETLNEMISKFDQIGVIIPLSGPKPKRRLAELLNRHDNIVFPNIVHPSVIIEGNMQIGIGNIISAGCVIACDLRAGNFNLFNRCCTTGHDVSIGDYNTLNPASVVSGNVTIGDECLIGAGAVILQGLNIGDKAVLGAGAVLTTDAECNTTLVGIPARKIEKR